MFFMVIFKMIATIYTRLTGKTKIGPIDLSDPDKVTNPDKDVE